MDCFFLFLSRSPTAVSHTRISAATVYPCSHLVVVDAETLKRSTKVRHKMLARCTLQRHSYGCHSDHIFCNHLSPRYCRVELEAPGYTDVKWTKGERWTTIPVYSSDTARFQSYVGAVAVISLIRLYLRKSEMAICVTKSTRTEQCGANHRPPRPPFNMEIGKGISSLSSRTCM